MEKELSDLFFDDITWCESECSKTYCFRHPDNMKCKTGIHSFANFKDTDVCEQSQHVLDRFNKDNL